MKFKTVREGEQAVIYNYLGEGRVIIGPKRVFLFRERLERLRHYRATPQQYLVVKTLEGHVVHKPGPAEMFQNPLEHLCMEMRDGLRVRAGHMCVVYHRVARDNVERRVVAGPALLCPSAEEWLHEFEWHGTEAGDKTDMVVGARKFSQLPTAPEQFYYNVREVRTIDDTTMRVKLMVFYQLRDVITMLEATHDPIADLINAVCADVIAYVSRLTYQEFLGKTSELSRLEKYPHLVQRAHKIGFSVTSVVFRGYHASDQLQEMHDRAIESRMQLRVQDEVQGQLDRLTAFRIECERKRVMQNQEAEQRRAGHEQSLASLRQQHQLQQRHLAHAAQLLDSGKRQHLDLELRQEKEAVTRQHLQDLGEVGVALTSYLVQQTPPPPTEEVHMTSSSSTTV